MDVFSLVGKLKLDGAKEVNGELQNTSSKLENVKKGMKVAGAAMTAAGAAGLKLTTDSRKMNAALATTGVTLGKSAKEMRGLALDTTNVTFPLESVQKTFDTLTRAGMRNTDEIKKAATAFDTLGDATGSSAEAVADILIPALKVFGEEIPQSAEELDKFTWLTKNTTVELSEFGSVMSYVAQYGDSLNLSLDDMIAIMAALESKGKSGATATKMFRTAVTQAANGTATLNEALGLTDEEIAQFRGEMDAASGATQTYADAANTQYGLVAKVKQKFEEFRLQLGSLLEPLEGVLAIMTALGPIMMFVSTAAGIGAIKFAIHTAALIAYKVASLAATVATTAFGVALHVSTAGLLLAIGAIITAAVMLLTRWKDVVKFLKEHWAKLLIILAPGIAFPALIIQNWDRLKSFFTNLWDNLRKLFLGGILKILDGISKFTNFIPGLKNAVNGARESIRGMIDADKVQRDAKAATKAVEEMAKKEREALKESLKQQLEAEKANLDDIQSRHETFNKTKRELAEEAAEDVKSALDTELEAARAASEANKEHEDELLELTEDRIKAEKAAADAALKEDLNRLNIEMDAARTAYDEKIAMINDEYKANLKLVDEEAAAKLEALESQIDQLDDVEKAENKARKEQEREAKKTSLKLSVQNAKSVDDRIEAQAELDDYLEQLDRERIAEARNMQREQLRLSMEAIRKEASDKRNALAADLEANKAHEDKLFDLTQTRIEADKTSADAALEYKLNALDTELEAARVANEANKALEDELLELTLARIEAEKIAADAALEEELNRLEARSQADIAALEDQLAALEDHENNTKSTWQRITDFVKGWAREYYKHMIAPYLWMYDKILWVKDRVVEVFTAMKDKIVDVFKAIPDAFKDAFNRMTGLVRDFSWSYSGWKVMGKTIIPSFTFEPFKGLPQLAAGGEILRAGAAIIGEQGPEILSLPKAAQVAPLPTSAGAGASRTVEVHVHTQAFMGNEHDAYNFAKLMSKYIEQNAKYGGVW